MTPTAVALLGFAAGAVLTAGHAAHDYARRLDAATHAATHDPLTGLLNRDGFQHAASALLADAGEAGTVILFDLDRFKPVNDRFGHDVGDAVLIQVAHRLRIVVGSHGVLGRLGGDEFVAVLDSTAEEAVRVLVAARAAVAVPIPVRTADGGVLVQVGVSAGVAAAAPGLPLSALLKAADVAMYQAKRNGQDWAAQQASTLAVEHRPTVRLRDGQTFTQVASR